MKIAEPIYECVVEPSYKKPTRSDANRAGHSRNKRGEDALSRIHPETGKSAGRRRNIYVDRSERKSKTCLIHGPGYSSDECKVLGDFGAKYAKGKPTKDHGNRIPGVYFSGR